MKKVRGIETHEQYVRRYLRYLLRILIVIMIAVIFCSVCTVVSMAAPIAGSTAHMYSQLIKPPICDWQNDILMEALYGTDNETNKRRDNKSVYRTDNSAVPTGDCLTKRGGVFDGPSGKETWYNLPMGQVVLYMEEQGYDYRYWIREDGVKMYGDYVMCAADLKVRPKGTLVPTSLGTGIVCDTGTFVETNSCQLDIAVNW